MRKITNSPTWPLVLLFPLHVKFKWSILIYSGGVNIFNLKISTFACCVLKQSSLNSFVFVSRVHFPTLTHDLSTSVFVGSASRRCMLDNNGVAFWGPPSFARCVSLEYRYLHLSVSFLILLSSGSHLDVN